MKEIIVHPLPTLTTELRDVPIPSPAGDELVIKVVVAASNVKDWVHITAMNKSVNSGDDIAGTVHAIGAAAAATGEFKIGDRVAGLHKLLEPGGAYAEYAVVPSNTAFVIPEKISFEEAATIPLVSLTAAFSLFRRQDLPPPWSPYPPSNRDTPLIIYGASSALGCYAIKLASLSNIHPIIAISGSSKSYVETLLDEGKGDKVVDYRQGVEAWKQEVKELLSGKSSPKHALDAISGNGTWIPLAQLLADLWNSSEYPSESPVLSVVSGANAYTDAAIPPNIDIRYTYVGTAHYGAYKPSMPKQPTDKDAVMADIEFSWVMLRYIARMLSLGKYSGHPHEVIPGGLGGVEQGLNDLKAGKARGKKFVYRILDTEGL